MSKILIVDDQLCVRQLLTAELTLQGYHVASSGDAESAKGRLLSFRPDVVILDLYLGGPDRFDLFDDIKGKYPRKIPFYPSLSSRRTIATKTTHACLKPTAT